MADALLTFREHVIAPLLAGVADPRIRRTPRHWTEIDRHYQALRLEMMALLPIAGIGIACDEAPTTFCRSYSLKRLGVVASWPLVGGGAWCVTGPAALR